MANSRMAMSQMHPYKLSAPSSVLSSKNLNAWKMATTGVQNMKRYLGIVGFLAKLGENNSLHQSSKLPRNVMISLVQQEKTYVYKISIYLANSRLRKTCNM